MTHREMNSKFGTEECHLDTIPVCLVGTRGTRSLQDEITAYHSSVVIEGFLQGRDVRLSPITGIVNIYYSKNSIRKTLVEHFNVGLKMFSPWQHKPPGKTPGIFDGSIYIKILFREIVAVFVFTPSRSRFKCALFCNKIDCKTLHLVSLLY